VRARRMHAALCERTVRVPASVRPSMLACTVGRTARPTDPTVLALLPCLLQKDVLTAALPGLGDLSPATATALRAHCSAVAAAGPAHPMAALCNLLLTTLPLPAPSGYTPSPRHVVVDPTVMVCAETGATPGATAGASAGTAAAPAGGCRADSASHDTGAPREAGRGGDSPATVAVAAVAALCTGAVGGAGHADGTGFAWAAAPPLPPAGVEALGAALGASLLRAAEAGALQGACAAMDAAHAPEALLCRVLDTLLGLGVTRRALEAVVHAGLLPQVWAAGLRRAGSLARADLSQTHPHLRPPHSGKCASFPP
jgi:hypothetical protein